MTAANIPAASDINAVLSRLGEGYVEKIVADAAARKAEVEKRGSNAATRKAGHLKALEKANKKVKGSADDLAPVTKAAHQITAKSKAVATFLPEAVENGLSAEQAVALMDQIISGKLLKELIDAVYEAGKVAVFRTMDEQAAAEGAEFPEHTNRVLDVPELGKRFSREGISRGKASLDEEALIEAIGQDRWEEITSERVIPAQTVRVIDEDKLAEAVNTDPALLEQVRSAVVPGAWRAGRLMIKDIPPTKG